MIMLNYYSMRTMISIQCSSIQQCSFISLAQRRENF